MTSFGSEQQVQQQVQYSTVCVCVCTWCVCLVSCSCVPVGVQDLKERIGNKDRALVRLADS